MGIFSFPQPKKSYHFFHTEVLSHNPKLASDATHRSDTILAEDVSVDSLSLLLLETTSCPDLSRSSEQFSQTQTLTSEVCEKPEFRAIREKNSGDKLNSGQQRKLWFRHGTLILPGNEWHAFHGIKIGYGGFERTRANRADGLREMSKKQFQRDARRTMKNMVLRNS